MRFSGFFYIQNIRSAVLSGMWALPTLQVTVMETIPFTFPRRVFMNRQALRGMRTFAFPDGGFVELSFVYVFQG